MTLKVNQVFLSIDAGSNQGQQCTVRQTASSNITASPFVQVHNKSPKNVHETSEFPWNTIFREKAFWWKIPD